MANGAAQLGNGFKLEFMIGMENFLHSLADAQPAEQLEIGKAVEKQDAFGQPIGMLHLIDRFRALEGGEALDAPIMEETVMQPILVGCREFVLQRFVEQLDDARVALHCRSPCGCLRS